MNRLFNFYKKDKPSFEIKKENLEKIEMANFAKEPMCIVDEPQMGYEDPRWIEKSNSIKARDNYTCQLCHVFNPMQDTFVFVKQGDYETIHRYRKGNIYEIIVRDYGLPISFAFSYVYHLVMPRLNVHHKIYFKNRDLWDYQDDCLVTLCENCHHYIHSLNDVGIPIVEEHENGKIILVGKTRQKLYEPKMNHTDLGTFQPFALVKENVWGLGLKGQDLADFQRAKNDNKQWYDYHETLDNNVVDISYLVCKDPTFNEHINEYTDEEIKRVVDFITRDFIENILNFRKVENE